MTDTHCYRLKRIGTVSELATMSMTRFMSGMILNVIEQIRRSRSGGKTGAGGKAMKVWNGCGCEEVVLPTQEMR